MTRIAIVGGGRAATLHAEAALAVPGVELVGVGGRPGTAGALSAAAGVPDLSLEELIRAATGRNETAKGGGLIVAVSPDEAEAVLGAIPAGTPILLESPVRLTYTDDDTPPRPVMTGVNLLHAPLVKKGLRAIAELGDVHHLTMRGRAVPRHQGSLASPATAEIFALPFAGSWPVLLAAAGSAVVAVSAVLDATAPRATLSLELADGRTATASLEWVEAGAGPAVTEIEAASSTGVATIGLWPIPTLELDGRPIAPPDDHPLVALGFVEQIRRFAVVCEGRGEPWPPLGVGIGVTRLTDAAATSATQGGAVTTV